MVVVPFVFACAAAHGEKPAVRSLILLSVGLVVAAAAAAQTPTTMPTVPVTVGQQRWLLTPEQRLAIEQARRSRSASEAKEEEASPDGPWQLQGIAQPLRLGGSAWINGQLFRGGDVIGPGVRLHVIRSDRVVLERNGALHVLRPGQTLESDGRVRDLLPPSDGAEAARMSNRSTSAGGSAQR